MRVATDSARLSSQYLGGGQRNGGRREGERAGKGERRRGREKG